MARSRGHISNGNTLPMMSANDCTNPCVAAGCTRGTINGTSREVHRFIITVYNVSEPALPPSLPVTTAAAVAVGQMKQSIMLSVTTFHPDSPMAMSRQARATNSSDWNNSIHNCQWQNLMSLAFTLQKVRNSMQKSNIGCT